MNWGSGQTDTRLTKKRAPKLLLSSLQLRTNLDMLEKKESAEEVLHSDRPIEVVFNLWVTTPLGTK